MKHSKGPWEVIEGQGCAKVRQVVSTPCVPALRAIVYGNNWRADAHLFKAAPDMLELLEKVDLLLDLLMKQVNWGDSAINAECLCELNETLLQLSPTIRLAKGE